MLGVDIASYNHNFLDDRQKTDIICPLLKEVLGYNDNEIEGFLNTLFFPPLAINLSNEEVRQIMQPFWDYDISVWAFEIDDNSRNIILPDYDTRYLTSKYFGVVSQPPQEHYYDKPVVTRDKLIDPWHPPTNNPNWVHPSLKSKIQIQNANIPKCPICQSTNLSKITIAKKAAKIALFGIFGMGDNGKTWKCNNCGSKF